MATSPDDMGALAVIQSQARGEIERELQELRASRPELSGAMTLSECGLADEYYSMQQLSGRSILLERIECTPSRAFGNGVTIEGKLVGEDDDGVEFRCWTAAIPVVRVATQAFGGYQAGEARQFVPGLLCRVVKQGETFSLK